jgi:hypothetical protein
MPSRYSAPATELDLASEITRTGHDTWVVQGESYADWDAARDAAAAAVYTQRAKRLEYLLGREGYSGSADELLPVGFDSFTRRDLRAEVKELRARAARHALRSADLRTGNN